MATVMPQRSRSQGQQGQVGDEPPDRDYNLISVMYHALQAADTCVQYTRDAGGEEELVRFFDEARKLNLQIAQDARQLLKSRL